VSQFATRWRHRHAGDMHHPTPGALTQAMMDRDNRTRTYHGSRTHLSLKKDSPTPRRVLAPTDGKVIALPQVGGLHHRYERRAA